MAGLIDKIQLSVILKKQLAGKETQRLRVKG